MEMLEEVISVLSILHPADFCNLQIKVSELGSQLFGWWKSRQISADLIVSCEMK